MTLGAQIKRRRVDRRLTQVALAAKVGIHRVYLAHVEDGRKTPSLAVLDRLAKALGTKITDLLS
jgi:transcriptional regulator with XRE-family HTH domain